jgi:periplasmic protein TonB
MHGFTSLSQAFRAYYAECKSQGVGPKFLRMYEPTKLVPKAEGALANLRPRDTQDAKQRRLMVVALALLLFTLCAALYWDREFWFPENQVSDSDQPGDLSPVPAASSNSAPAKLNPAPAPAKSKHINAGSKPVKKTAAAVPSAPSPASPAQAVAATATTTRTVLPPLEVEVVAGDNHRTVRPGSNSVRVDLQPGTPPDTTQEANGTTETAAGVTSNAAERVQMSADTSAVVSRSVRPGYPLLARQMKVQGSVILQALISKEGTIQGLQVMSGPPILATAAQDAVKQWHFKPHMQNNEAVETQAKITVNFTISTN